MTVATRASSSSRGGRSPERFARAGSFRSPAGRSSPCSAPCPEPVRERALLPAGPSPRRDRDRNLLAIPPSRLSYDPHSATTLVASSTRGGWLRALPRRLSRSKVAASVSVAAAKRRCRRPAWPRPGLRPAPRPVSLCDGERDDHGQQTGHGSQFAPQRELAEDRPGTVGPDLLGADEDSEGYREIQRSPALPKVSRGKVHGDTPGRVLVTAVSDRATDALSGFLQSRVRETDDGEPGQARGNVNLDANGAAVQPLERGRKE